MDKRIGIIFISLVALMLSINIFTSFGGEERQARKTVENYMDAVRKGEEFDALKTLEGFYDVFDYEYLRTLDVRQEKDTTKFSYDVYKNFYSTTYSTFQEYKQEKIEYYSALWGDLEIIENDHEELIIWDGESYYNVYTFLYNVEIANEFGEKIYKKAEFTVEPGTYFEEDNELVDGWVITDIYLR